MITIKSPRLRAFLKIFLPYICIPALILIGVFFSEGNSFIYITVAVALLSIIFFISGIERKKIGTRRLITVAVMTSLSVVGRFIPFFKPISALTIITSMYLGGEAGFAVGAFSALISDFYFGMGPWTPFQMFAWGFIGLLASFLPLKKSRVLLLSFGFLSGIFYSAIMDVWTVAWYNGAFSLPLYLSALISAVPFTLLYSVSNVVFLFFFARPFGEKLERIKIKYGI